MTDGVDIRSATVAGETSHPQSSRMSGAEMEVPKDREKVHQSPSTSGFMPLEFGRNLKSLDEDRSTANAIFVSFSQYPFLTINNRPAIPPEDFQFLGRQGCLKVPKRVVLNEFMRQYFLYLHPVLPILDEGVFWDVYAQRPSRSQVNGKISLVVFQAMIFACCNFVSLTILNRLGLESKRSARSFFYRRAKLLFDLEAESLSINKSRAALLLASWSYSSYEVPRSPPTPWISIAIHYAKEADAHIYMNFDTDSEEHAIRKRLWWICIIRDCLLSFGMRRRIHIAQVDFDFSFDSTIGSSDLKDEIGKSMVYEDQTKHRLHQVLGLLSGLCICLTDILDLAFPVENNLYRSHPGPEALTRLEKSKTSLRWWYLEASHRLPRAEGASDDQVQHHSVTLFVNLMYMYYYAAKIVLGHYEILQFTPNVTWFSTMVSRAVRLKTIQCELQEAIVGTTGCLEHLMRFQLIKRLPVTAISCTALPLMLHSLDVEVYHSSKMKNSKEQNVLYRRFKMLKEAMETYQFQYEGVDWISSAINHVVNLAQRESCFNTSPQNNQTPDTGIENENKSLIGPFKTGYYLRLAITLDIAFSKGQLPECGGISNVFPQLSGLNLLLEESSDIMCSSQPSDIMDHLGISKEKTWSNSPKPQARGVGELANKSPQALQDTLFNWEDIVPVQTDFGSSTINPSKDAREMKEWNTLENNMGMSGEGNSVSRPVYWLDSLYEEVGESNNLNLFLSESPKEEFYLSSTPQVNRG